MNRNGPRNDGNNVISKELKIYNISTDISPKTIYKYKKKKKTCKDAPHH